MIHVERSWLGRELLFGPRQSSDVTMRLGDGSCVKIHVGDEVPGWYIRGCKVMIIEHLDGGFLRWETKWVINVVRNSVHCLYYRAVRRPRQIGHRRESLPEWVTTQLERCPCCGRDMPAPPYLSHLRHRCPPDPRLGKRIFFDGLVTDWFDFITMVHASTEPSEWHHLDPAI